MIHSFSKDLKLLCSEFLKEFCLENQSKYIVHRGKDDVNYPGELFLSALLVVIIISIVKIITMISVKENCFKQCMTRYFALAIHIQ